MKKQLHIGVLASIGMMLLILDSKTALEGARLGIELCLKTVIPSLFPFFLLSVLLTSSLIGLDLPVFRLLGKLFGIPKGAESILVSAFLGGYPVGAQSIEEAYRNGSLSKQDAERMLAFCNNAGPAFLFGMVASLFPEKWMSWALWGIHIVSALFVSSLYIPNDHTAKISCAKNVSLSTAMYSAIRVMSQVCGWVVLFRVIIRFLSRWILWVLPTALQVAVTGLLELSNGCWELGAIESIPMRFILCSGMLAFGGICVTMQTVSVTKGLSMRFYFQGKLLQTIFSIILSSAIILQPIYVICVIVFFFLLIHHKIKKYSRNPQVVDV